MNINYSRYSSSGRNAPVVIVPATTALATSAVAGMVTTRVRTVVTSSLVCHCCSTATPQGVVRDLDEAVRAHGASLARRAPRMWRGGCRGRVRAEVGGQESRDTAGGSHHGRRR